MISKLKKLTIKDGQRVTKILWGLFLVVFFFPRRFLLISLDNNAYGQVIPCLNWFFCFSEFLLPLVLLGVLFFYQEAPLKNIPKRLWALMAALILSLGVGVGVHEGMHFDLLMLVRIIELWAVSYLVTRQIMAPKKMFAVVLVGITIQAGLGLAQLATQSDVGLAVLGEPQISKETLGIPKIEVADDKYIRPMGTLTHANAWGSAMLIGVLLLPVWYRKLLEDNRKVSLQKARKAMAKQKWGPGVIYGLGGVLAVAAAFSFSRSVWLGLFLLIFLAAWRNREKMWFLGGMVLVGVGAVIWQWPLLMQRVMNWQAAFVSRVELWDYAIRSMRENPWGMGVGKFVQSLASNMDLRIFAPWEMQPVHNVPLLVGVQLGWLAFAAVFVYVLAMLIRTRTRPLAFLGLVAVGVVSLTDHFFWTDYTMAVLLVVFLTVWEIYFLNNKKAEA